MIVYCECCLNVLRKLKIKFNNKKDNSDGYAIGTACSGIVLEAVIDEEPPLAISALGGGLCT